MAPDTIHTIEYKGLPSERINIQAPDVKTANGTPTQITEVYSALSCMVVSVAPKTVSIGFKKTKELAAIKHETTIKKNMLLPALFAASSFSPLPIIKLKFAPPPVPNKSAVAVQIVTRGKLILVAATPCKPTQELPIYIWSTILYIALSKKLIMVGKENLYINLPIFSVPRMIIAPFYQNAQGYPGPFVCVGMPLNKIISF
jgi:hypothetical protein